MIENVIETLTPPEAWIKGSLARSRRNRVVGPETVGAVCWCLMGAAQRADDDWAHNAGYHLMVRAITELFPDRLNWDDGTGLNRVARFNDHPDTTHEDVLRVLTRARELELPQA